MGVRGLQKFAEEHKVYKELDLVALSKSKSSSDGCRPKVVVDTMNCHRYFYQGLVSLIQTEVIPLVTLYN
jgi:hypothetical protein